MPCFAEPQQVALGMAQTRISINRGVFFFFSQKHCLNCWCLLHLQLPWEQGRGSTDLQPLQHEGQDSRHPASAPPRAASTYGGDRVPNFHGRACLLSALGMWEYSGQREVSRCRLELGQLLGQRCWRRAGGLVGTRLQPAGAHGGLSVGTTAG